MFKFGVKVAVAAGSIYYLSEEGIWKNSEETTKLYGRINTVVKPYVKEASSQLPIEIPDLPNSDKLSYLAKQYWNEGVTKTFKFLCDLPDHVSNLTQQGVEMVASNDDMKNFFSGSSSESQKDVK